MRRALLVAALVLVPACGIKLPPCIVDGTCLPTPAPTPTPTPVPEPTPVPTPTPTPEPPPLGGCKYPATEAQLLPTGDEQTLLGRVRDTTRALGDLRDPSRNPVALARENNRRLAAALRAQGYCAFAGQEAIFVQAVLPNLWWEEYHAAAETDGGWTQNPARGSHSNPGPTTNVPPDAPPIDEPAPTPTACGDPQPPPLGGIVVHRRDIRDGWERFDSTPVTAEGNRAYCDSVGFANRNSCPARAEEPAWTKGDRLACERVMLLADAPEWVWTGDERDGGLRDGSNGFTFDHRKGSSGSLKVCGANRRVCVEVIP